MYHILQHLSFKSIAKPVIVIAFLFGVALYLNSLFPPISDDLHWAFLKDNVDGNVVQTDKHISSAEEILRSCYNHRFVGNGRMANDWCIVLSSLFSKNIFNLLNSCAFVCLILLAAMLSFRKITAWTVMITTAGLLIFLPNIPRTIFWMCGAVNYLWAACVALLFVFLMERVTSGTAKPGSPTPYTHEHRFDKFGLYVALPLACMFHETLGVTLLSALVVYIFINKRALQRPGLLITLALLGTFYSIVSPGIFNRALQGTSLSERFASNFFAIAH